MLHTAPLARQAASYAIDRVDAFAVPGRCRPIKNRVQSLPNAPRRFGGLRPDRRQNSENVSLLYRVNGLPADRRECQPLQRRKPLPNVLSLSLERANDR